MGVCLSCIRGNIDDDEFNDENSPLLQNQNHDDLLQQQRELQLEMRNKELNAILNSTNELLIDISSLTSPAMSNNNNGGGLNGSIVMHNSQTSLSKQYAQDQNMSNSTNGLNNINNNTNSHNNNNNNNTTQDFSILNNVSILDPNEVKEEINKQLSELSQPQNAALLKKIEESCKIDTSKIGPLIVDF